MSRYLGPDPLVEQIDQVLSRLEQGQPPSVIETVQVDVKEEPARRTATGTINQPDRENEEAAGYLAGEMACMANTAGGGAIILGVADDGTRIGTGLDPEWLRHRIYELTSRTLTVNVVVVHLGSCRLLVLSVPEAIELIRYKGRFRWRVNDNCVDVDPTSWHNRRMQRSGFDWSAQPAGHTLSNVNPVAAQIARRYLRDSGKQDAGGLADATDEDLIRRLNLADGQGRLSNAGSLLFVATPDIGIDYIRRNVAGGDSTNRIRSASPLIQQIAEVEQASNAVNPIWHIPLGLIHDQVRSIPARAMREAIINGVTHRDWHSQQPTTIEHVGDQYTVSSPGGFIGEITPSNIITHPAEPRYRSLAEAMATLQLAEREGIGVDRMNADMLIIGRPRPEFTEIPGPYVRVSLIGGEPDQLTMKFNKSIEPATSQPDLDRLLLIEHLIQHGWVDSRTAAPTLQRPLAETETVLQRTTTAISANQPIISPVQGIPASQPPAYRLSDHSRKALASRIQSTRTPEGREAIILSWAKSRRRISSVELADLAGITVSYSGRLLAQHAENGQLVASRPNKRGRGFHYLPADWL